MKDLAIVIPLGISTPGTPVLDYLKFCVEMFQNQITKYTYNITFACDDNVSDDVKNYLIETGHSISWYDPFYFFRKGSIWKKIILEWQKENSEYVAFCHYDDVWSSNKIESQLNLIKHNNLDCSWSSVRVINEKNEVISNDLAQRIELNESTIRLGQTYAFSHSTILNKEKFLNSGILKYIETCAPVYEGLHYAYCHKLKGMKDPNSTFFHRVHSNSITNNLHTETESIKQIREIAEYPMEQIVDDKDSISFEEIIKEIYS